MQTAPTGRLLRLEQADAHTAASKPILGLGCGGPLAVKLASVMAAKGLSAQVHAKHFHKWCRDQPKMAVQNAGSLE